MNQALLIEKIDRVIQMCKEGQKEEPDSWLLDGALKTVELIKEDVLKGVIDRQIAARRASGLARVVMDDLQFFHSELGQLLMEIGGGYMKL